VKKHHGPGSTVLFDGYNNNSISLKSDEHKRRASLHTSKDILFEGHSITTTNQTEFLANSYNKGRCIEQLIPQLQEATCTCPSMHVLQAESDADEYIVSTTINACGPNTPGVVTAKDNDVLAMLVARKPPDYKLFMVTHYNESKLKVKVYDIDALQKALSKIMDPLLILLVHAGTGCNTNAAPFNRGKTIAFNLLKSDANLCQEVFVFCLPNQSQATICEVGERFLLALYNATQFPSLDS